MKQLHKFPSEELMNATGPFVTIYQKQSATPTSADDDFIHFKNLLREAKEKVKASCEGSDCEALLEQLESFRNDTLFWRSTSGSVAFIFTPGESFFYLLDVNVKNQVCVSETPMLLPIMENFQYIRNFQLLTISNQSFALYNGQKFQLEPVKLPEDAPDTLEKALGEELSGRENNVGSRGAGVMTGQNAGNNEKSNEQEIDQENFFRVIDGYVLEHYSSKSELPLIVFALKENYAAFKRVSKNPYLSEYFVDSSPAQLSLNDIQAETEKLTNRVLKERHDAMLARYRETTPQYKLGSQLEDLYMASQEGRIEVLFVEKNCEINGYVDENGQFHESGNSDFLSLLANNVAATKGKVYVLEKAQMPDLKEVAAILRY